MSEIEHWEPIDSIQQSNAYLPAWCTRYIAELVTRASHDVILRDWRTDAPENERIGYMLIYAVGEGYCRWLWRDYDLADMYAQEVLDLTAEMVIAQIERIAENGQS